MRRGRVPPLRTSGRRLLFVHVGVRFWVVTALAVVGAASFAVGLVELWAWNLDGMDPGTQPSALVWKVPFVIGIVALSPAICTLAWLYVRSCVRATRTFFTDPEPITLDRGW